LTWEVPSYGNLAIAVGLSLWFLLAPFLLCVWYLSDPALRGPGVPRFASRLHHTLAPRYERWARQRVSSDLAHAKPLCDISGTEWPVFGSAFYLWGMESLQKAWDRGERFASESPSDHARAAIEASAALLADPGHASWVKRHWGEDYLHRENAFYRMLLIGGFTTYQRLLHSDRYLPIVRDQVQTLSVELDSSAYGLLNDYPGQCYPGDVLAAIAMIKRADAVLGTDHTDFVKRAVRGFSGAMVDRATGLPPYAADLGDTAIIGPARGCSNSYLLFFAPEIWPETAKQWYRSYEEHFWQKRWGAVGFREFSKATPSSDWYCDVDAGPVIAGHGIAAGAFGVAAARANGRFDHAYPLAAEVIVASWPLLDGTLLGPRILSDYIDAPYLGEASLLFIFTHMPAEGMDIVQGGHLPPFLYGYLLFYLGVGTVIVLAAVWLFRRRQRRFSEAGPMYVGVQLGVWTLLVFAGGVLAITAKPAWGVLLLLVAQGLPLGPLLRRAA
jgi:hypothetical protein